MEKILKQAFEVFGNKLPERHEYSATVAKPATLLEIKKAFGSFKEFAKQYNIFVIEQRNKEVKEKVVTKPAPKKVTKVTKDV